MSLCRRSTKSISTRISLLILASFLLVAASGHAKFTDREKAAVKKLKEVADQQELLYQDYMKTDSFLLPFLRSKDMNIKSAYEMLKKAIQWRKESKIDQVVGETGLKCDTLYPAITDLVDRNGRPVMIINIAEWNIRKFVLAGKQDQFVRCFMRYFEILLKKARTANQNVSDTNATPDKEQTTQMLLLVDMSGYSLREHACASCVTSYLKLLGNMESYYPQLWHKILLVNTPTIFDLLFQLVKPALSPTTKSAINVFGHDQQKWKPALHKLIEPDQLPAQLGGTKAIDKASRVIQKRN